MNKDPFDTSDYLLGEMEPADQREAETLMAQDDDLRRRVEALAAVCSRLEDLPGEAWEPAEPPPLGELPDPDPEPSAAEDSQTRRGRGRALLARPLAAGAVAAGLIGAGFGAGFLVGDGGDPASEEAGAGPQQRIPLNPIASIDPPPNATILIKGDGAERQAELSAHNLPVSKRNLYELWLLDGSRGQMSLGSFAPDESGDAAVAMPLPVPHEAYTYLDISREPRDGDPGHSGHSILRASTSP